MDGDENGNLYKGVIVFMIHNLKKSVSIVTMALPEVSIDGKWLAEKFSNSIINLVNAAFKICGIVTDNHLANVAAFCYLLQMFCSTIHCIFKILKIHPRSLCSLQCPSAERIVETTC